MRYAMLGAAHPSNDRINHTGKRTTLHGAQCSGALCSLATLHNPALKMAMWCVSHTYRHNRPSTPTTPGCVALCRARRIRPLLRRLTSCCTSQRVWYPIACHPGQGRTPRATRVGAGIVRYASHEKRHQCILLQPWTFCSDPLVICRFPPPTPPPEMHPGEIIRLQLKPEYGFAHKACGLPMPPTLPHGTYPCVWLLPAASVKLLLTCSYYLQPVSNGC